MNKLLSILFISSFMLSQHVHAAAFGRRHHQPAHNTLTMQESDLIQEVSRYITKEPVYFLSSQDAFLAFLIHSGCSMNTATTFSGNPVVIDAIARIYYLHTQGKYGLPKWLAEGFTGVSIQDLIDYGMIPKFNGRGYDIDYDMWGEVIDYPSISLSLSNKYICDITGLNKIPNIHLIQDLYLYNNKIKHLNPAAFIGLSNLRSLHLENNQVNELNHGTFAALTGLRLLNLRNNHITFIRPGAFTGLTFLNTLELSGNMIGILYPDAFGGGSSYPANLINLHI